MRAAGDIIKGGLGKEDRGKGNACFVANYIKVWFGTERKRGRERRIIWLSIESKIDR